MLNRFFDLAWPPLLDSNRKRRPIGRRFPEVYSIKVVKSLFMGEVSVDHMFINSDIFTILQL